MIVCKECGGTMEDGAVFCKYCGVKIGAQNESGLEELSLEEKVHDLLLKARFTELNNMLKQKADTGDAASIQQYCLFLFNFAKNYSEVISWTEWRSVRSEGWAHYLRGLAYETRKDDFSHKREAAKNYRLAIEAGDIRAYFRLGNLYETGGLNEGIPDLVEAQKNYMLGAEYGSIDCRIKLGLTALISEDEHIQESYMDIYELYDIGKYNAAAVSARRLVEYIVKQYCEQNDIEMENTGNENTKKDINDLIQELKNKRIITETIFDHMNEIRVRGNKAAHYGGIGKTEMQEIIDRTDRIVEFYETLNRYSFQL